MARPLTILYAGAALSGRTTSLAHVANESRDQSWSWEFSARLVTAFTIYGECGAEVLGQCLSRRREGVESPTPE